MNILNAILDPVPEEDVLLEEEVYVSEEHNIVLWNDDVNTFDFVIECLIEICHHDRIQAEQCAYIVHYNGKCAVKKGSFSELEPMCHRLLDRGLTATIE